MYVQQKWVSACQSASPKKPPAPPQGWGSFHTSPPVTQITSPQPLRVFFFIFVFSQRRDHHLPAELHYYERKKNRPKKKRGGGERTCSSPQLIVWDEGGGWRPRCGGRLRQVGWAEAVSGKYWGGGGETAAGRWGGGRGEVGGTAGAGPAPEGVPRRGDLPAGLPPTSLPRLETKWRPDGAGAEAAPRRFEPGRRRRQRRRWEGGGGGPSRCPRAPPRRRAGRGVGAVGRASGAAPGARLGGGPAREEGRRWRRRPGPPRSLLRGGGAAPGGSPEEGGGRGRGSGVGVRAAAAGARSDCGTWCPAGAGCGRASWREGVQGAKGGGWRQRPFWKKVAPSPGLLFQAFFSWKCCLGGVSWQSGAL